ncbi:T9SS type B sorting domain-containing protein [Flavobacterium litorale]|uniref:T9SS type B sorting domain-containing protein n=1 Tax=Flavobacterium litorale TaxID=2856519 RepID=A0ABX8V6H1_9FLAO|nr:T9SS type B sorting domain-containing protein [Flavobacterium litorale]QYJ68087.1 T9SS type B sorting domain-containing protein [Flavobacterium litorale]
MTLFDFELSPLRQCARKLYILCAILLWSALYSHTTVAQEFLLDVNVTNQTCLGNGQLTLSVSNQNPDAPVTYIVYLLPNTVNAIYNNTNPIVSNLTDGTYLVVATQTIDGTTVSDEQEVIIADETEPLIYNVTSDSTVCGDDGIINIIVTQGNPETYEILTGPVTAPAQESNTFEGVPAGTYTVRVIDNCGEGIVKAHTVISTESVMVISGTGFPDAELPDCNTITISHTITPQNPDIPIPGPVNITYTLFPPDGGDPIIFTDVLGVEDETTQEVPFFYDTDYFYDLEITDGCGRIYSVPNNLIRQKLRADGGFDNAECGGKIILIGVAKYVAPYTITFTEFPEDFDPEIANTQHPGPFAGEQVIYGASDAPVPFGFYEFTITDACGRSETGTILIEEDEEIQPLDNSRNNDCEDNLGTTEIVLPGFILVGGNILTAPAEYIETLPYDLSGNINDDDNVEVDGLPPGIYQFEVIDECDNVYPIEIEIPEFSASGITYNARPDCAIGLGSIRVGSGFPLTAVTITSAPAAFSETLPFNAFEFVAGDGALYMDSLPPGEYTFTADTDCTDELTISGTVTGYEVTSNEISEVRYCGAFDLNVAHNSNGVAFNKFWLQKLIDPDTNTWGHPTMAGGNYEEGTLPMNNNSLEVNNNATTINLISTGNFRVLKSFKSFGNGVNEKDCVEILYEFEFFDDLNITDIKSLTCSGSVADVEITAIGAEPLTYTIISKNGDTSFTIGNGNNNIFLGLESAIYELRVDDPCGNFDTLPFNVAELPSLVNATAPNNIDICDEGGDGIENYNLADFDETILNGQSLDEVTLTYHSNENDAETGAAPLPMEYTANIGLSEIFARVVFNESAEDCYATTSFRIIIRELPQLQMQDVWSACEGKSVRIVADAGYESYLWSTEEETRAITVEETGEYTVTVTDTQGCETTKTVTVTNSQAPEINEVTIEDWTENNNIITVILENTTDLDHFEYSLDGIIYQESNTFTGLEPGQYDVYVRDKFDCGIATEDVFLLTYPKFFTPNGDGVNETWRIEFSRLEPDLHVYIYDRYGKAITGFLSSSEGWDGTLNGKKLPATDYWFVVTRQNGKEYKGHFSMVR